MSSSNAMELEGLKRCKLQLEALDLKPVSLTTDRHLQIQAYMRKSWPEVEHFYDTWHISKGDNAYVGVTVSVQITYQYRFLKQQLWHIIASKDFQTKLKSFSLLIIHYFQPTVLLIFIFRLEEEIDVIVKQKNAYPSC